MTHDQFSILGKTAIITGASRGIGKEIALEFARRGANLAIIGRDKQKLEASRESILDHLDREVLISCHDLDVANGNDVKQSLGSILDIHGDFEILINNAGISPVYARPEHISAQDFKSLMDVNIGGVFNCCQAYAPHLISRKGGSIINISSIAGLVGLEKQSVYAATKGAVELFTKGCALDWADKGIRVNSIAYGFVETDLTQGLRDHDILSEKLLAKTPLKRFAKVSECSGAAVFLASNAASYVTGSTIAVDGGWTAA
ncbi:MAG: SDR family NAD(P)-dependent oxidoreductase [Alphaproteobacteria bacterium]|nr:SDR family NAD(P)-dependent oxidoreductase [Alphaproteobacteria bacterium]